jgi:phosphoglycolate phosphatase
MILQVKMMSDRTSFQAAIFDLDGTLLDTLEDIGDSMNITLQKMGFPPHPMKAYRYLTGDGVHMLAEKSLPQGRKDEMTLQACIKEFRAEYARRFFNKTRPYDEIPELLDELMSRKISLNILSNKLDEFAKLAADRMLSRWRFVYVLGARQDVPKKPDPAGALLIARKLGMDPAAFAYLGDTDTDMRTAVQAGMFPAGALWGFRDEKELREGGARELIRSPTEFLRFFA